MLRHGFRSLNRCQSSRRALSNYNNNNSNNNNSGNSVCNAKFTPKSACIPKSTYDLQHHKRAFSTTSNPSSRPTSPNAQLNETFQDLQQHKMMETHHEIRISLITLINEFASHKIPQVSLNDLLKFKDFTPSNEIDNTINLIENSNTTLYTLLILNCKRLKEFKQLPYICVLNPNISNIYNTYIKSLEKLMRFINANSIRNEIEAGDIVDHYKDFKIPDLETNQKFLDVLHEILEIHSDNLPILSEGFKDISQYSLIDSDQAFLDNHLRERIMLRLISKHHLLLSEHFEEYSRQNSKLASINSIGMIDKNLNVVSLIKQVSDFVNDMSSLKYDEKISINFETIILDNVSTKIDKFKLSDTVSQHQIIFPYIASHLEYVLQEILKNSSRAQIENKVRQPIQITIVLNKRNPQSYLELRIRDQGKGITEKSLENLFTYSFTTVSKTSRDDNDNYDVFNNGTGTDANIIAGLGYGLPLSKLYVEMFGGDLELQTYEGWGTDVYIKLRGPESRLLE